MSSASIGAVKYFALLLLLSPLRAATVEVEIRDSEVWLIRDGKAKQLTRDGKAKLQALLSPGYDRVAYYEQCPQSENCIPSIVILDLSGKRLRSIQPNADETPCSSILAIEWAAPGSISAECHINPSLEQYIEIDLATGRNIRNLLGYGFTRSPDGRKVAHAGWIVHFAPRYVQSDYLQVDGLTVYPLPKGQRPLQQKGLSEPPQVVHQSGLTFSGIHEFQPGFFWSPDSRHIALIDCTFDWTLKSASQDSDGDESNRRCRLAIAGLDGQVSVHPLASFAPTNLQQPRVAWTGAHAVTLEIAGARSTFNIP